MSLGEAKTSAGDTNDCMLCRITGEGSVLVAI